MIPLRELQDQGTIGEKVYQQGDRLSARLRGLREGGSLYRNLNTPQPPPSSRVRNPPVTSKASKASKTGKGNKTKETSEQVPTEVPPPVPQSKPGRVERKGGKSRTAQGGTSEAKFKYRAPEPTFDQYQKYHWEGIDLNPGDNYQTPGNKYIDIANRLDREEKERQSKPIPLTFGENLTLIRKDTPPPN